MSLVPYKVTAIKKTDPTGNNILAGASVSIVTPSGGFAQIWDDEAGTIPRSNPFTVDSNGERQIWINGGEYSVSVSGGQSWDIKLTGGSDILYIENVAALSTFTPVAGQVYYLKEYNSGTGKGGGNLLAKSGVITPNDVTTFASATAGVYFERVNCQRVTLFMAGAYGDGTTDDYLAISRALSLNTAIYGDFFVYATSNQIDSAIISLHEMTIKDTNPGDANRRVIRSVSGSLLVLHNVFVDRNGNGTGGSLGGSAGVWAGATSVVVLKNVDVTGDDYGNGIAIIDCNDAIIQDCSAHDISCGGPAEPVITDDRIQGIWIQRGNNIQLINPRVMNLRCVWTGQASTPRFTRGIAVGGVDKLEITNPYVFSVDQCIDISGDEGPTGVTVTGGKLVQGATWGLKVANSGKNISVTNVYAEKCGLSGFVTSAPSTALSQTTSQIAFMNCRAVGTGFASGGATGATVGFRNITSGAAATYPRTVHYIGCTADADGQPMQYGFSSDSIASGTGDIFVIASDCSVFGASIKDYLGLNQHYTKRRANAVQTIANAANVLLNFPAITIDRQSAASVTPSQIVIPVSGLWCITANVNYSVNSTGMRGAKIYRNGSPISGAQCQVGPGSNDVTTVCVSTIEPLSKGDVIEVYAVQTSGGNLDTTIGSIFSAARIASGEGV